MINRKISPSHLLIQMHKCRLEGESSLKNWEKCKYPLPSWSWYSFIIVVRNKHTVWRHSGFF